MIKALTLTIDDRELELLTGTHAYLREDGTHAEACRPWYPSRADEAPALTPQIRQELAQIIKEAEALYDRAKMVLSRPGDVLSRPGHQ